MNSSLKEYIRHIVRECVQPTEAEDTSKNIEEIEEELQEFSGCAGIGGYSLPLGMNPDSAGRNKNKVTNKKPKIENQ